MYHEIKPKEKVLLELLIIYFKYLTSDQISQIKEVLGDEWDKNRIY